MFEITKFKMTVNFFVPCSYHNIYFRMTQQIHQWGKNSWIYNKLQEQKHNCFPEALYAYMQKKIKLFFQC